MSEEINDIEIKSDMVKEPAAVLATSYAESTTVPLPPHIEGLPETWDDLMKCFDEAEDEYERGETIPWEDARMRIRKHIKEYVA